MLHCRPLKICCLPQLVPPHRPSLHGLLGCSAPLLPQSSRAPRSLGITPLAEYCTLEVVSPPRRIHWPSQRAVLRQFLGLCWCLLLQMPLTLFPTWLISVLQGHVL